MLTEDNLLSIFIINEMRSPQAKPVAGNRIRYLICPLLKQGIQHEKFSKSVSSIPN